MRLLYDILTDIPVGFTEVEYLESTGTQYIDTNYSPKPTSTYKSTFQLTNITTTSGNWFCVFGSVESNNSTFTELFLPRASGGGNVNQILAGSHNSSYLRTDYSWAINRKYNFEMTPTAVSINGVSQGSISVDSSITCSHSIYLFARHEYNDAVRYNVNAKIHSFTIYEGDTLVRDFVPCLDSLNVPCMYDKVTKQAFYNQGTGTFSYGRKIIPVEYLESTGTQYIDTGVKGKNNIDFDYKCIFTNLDGTAQCVGGNWSGQPSSSVSLYLGLIRANGNFAYHYDGTSSPVVIMNTTAQDTLYTVQGHMWTGEQYMVINGTKSSVGTITSTFTSSLNMYLFGINNNGLSNPAYLKLYHCKVWDNGTLVRDYIPCIDENNVPYMFDKVTHTAYLNAGTGSFIVGKQLPKKKMRLIKTSKRAVPVGFQEVEYLASDSNQWIDTGYKMTNGKSSTFEGRIMWTASHGTANFFYGYRSVNSAEYHGDMRAFFIYGTTTTPPGRIAIRYGVDAENSTTQSVYLNQACRISFDGVNFKVNDTTVVTHSKTYSPANYQNMWLFNCNCTGYYSSDVSHFVGRIYRWTIYEEGVAVRDFIPYLDSNGRPCMWDSVEGKAYYNIGTGEFTYGRKIIPIEYIESSGTQYIDAGFTPNQYSKVELTYQISNDLSSGFPLFGSRTSASSNGYSYQRYGAGVMGGQYGANITQSTVVPDLNKHTVVRDANKIYLDGIEIVSQSIATFTCPGNLYINAMNNNGTAAIQNCGVRYYSCRIWGSDLARDFIPCKDENGVGYLFDKVSHTCFLNAGTGSFGVGNKINDITRFVVDGIPNMYRKVEYLQSSGTQYINSGIFPDKNTSVLYSCAVTGNINNKDTHIFGSRLSASSEAFDLAYMNTTPNGLETLRFISGSEYTQVKTSLVTATTIKNKNAYYMSSTQVKVNGTTVLTFTTSAYQGTYPLWLFGVNNAGTLHNQVIAQKVYGCEIWDNGAIVRNFIPVIRKSDSKPGMWDMVSKQFFTNAGTGEFTYN